MAAAKVLNQLGWLAKDGECVQLLVHKPNEAMRELAALVLASVPEAWEPNKDGDALGMLTAIVSVDPHVTAHWVVCDMPRPAQWAAQGSDDLRRKAALSAGIALCRIYHDVVKAAIAAHDRAREGAN